MCLSNKYKGTRILHFSIKLPNEVLDTKMYLLTIYKHNKTPLKLVAIK